MPTIYLSPAACRRGQFAMVGGVPTASVVKETT